MVKKINILSLFLCVWSVIFTQDKAFYWIEFTDKASSTYSIDNPEAFLSTKAIERRNRQNINVTEQDLPVPQNYVNQILSFDDVELHNTSRWMNAALIKTNNQASVESIKALSFVKSSDSIQTTALKPQNKPKNKFAQEVIQRKNNLELSFGNPVYGKAFNQIHLHNGEILHESGYRGEGMTLAVIDAGFIGADINLGLNSAFSNAQVLGTRNFIENNNEIFKSSTHGTYVFTTIAGNISGEYVGTCPNCDFWLLMSEDVNSETIIEEYFWLFAAEFADSVGVDVINTSLGYTEFDHPEQNHSYNDMDGNTTIAARAADIAAAKGILLFTSNGNSGNNDWKHLGTPADADSTIAVGATDSLGFIASFSSFGPSSDGEIKPNISGQGAPAALYHNDGFVVYGNGTSFSSPILSGLGACLWQAFPNKTNMQIKATIEKSGHIFNNPNDRHGYGIPDFSDAFETLGGTPPTSETGLVVYPTLFDDHITIKVGNQKISQLSISLHDIMGKLFYENTVNIDTKTTSTYINLKQFDLARGTYFLNLTFDDKSVQYRLVKR